MSNHNNLNWTDFILSLAMEVYFGNCPIREQQVADAIGLSDQEAPESWDAKDFIFSNKYYCPICATPEDGTCQVLVDWEIEKWGSCKVLEE